MSIPISVITLVRGRHPALQNFIKGLSLGTAMPAELIVVFMNEKPCELPTTPFEVKIRILVDSNLIPLAKARNLGAETATSENLVFLDVDCIPDRSLISDYSKILDDKHLFIGAVRYLPKSAIINKHFFSELFQLSSPDPIRSRFDNLPYELFWSLNFGCSRQVFLRIGGFDEGYEGYGAEDTDFAFRARKMNVPIRTTTINSYHQYHVSYDPPVNHIKDVINNANRFFEIWETWPMNGWLKKFEELGLLEWNSKLCYIREPTESELNQTRK